MKIKREINGQEFEIELTNEEIREAYLIEQADNDRADIRNTITDVIDESGDDDEDDVFWNQCDATVGQLRKLLDDDEAIARMAKELRDKLDNHDGVSELLRYACEEVISDEVE